VRGAQWFCTRCICGAQQCMRGAQRVAARAVQVLRAGLERSAPWPEHGVPEWAPVAIREGLFLPRHARLISLLVRALASGGG
jgi:hypothetical protein